ncbi:pyruvate decarboxylase [Metschnikowia bicuspidata var. bicuspidata NRRL YB-4993]|uniref:Pyruvate decarboxylase n=1 Tax=Metschnikowia bicuspidata var. bicuspidata NRRL YB-4993 TaxID=869754 RepID=A0A1A0HDM7_9ASCO|nr:pyruvate decarboxylase [Metschnikowia bicuspidata var. bicuspidata NRRL YB-4993]OBA22080.1 pyruvate decarboxylase [Metschnikowia bicuspidata var. bicuspidata NRRL YB-4993]
MAPITTASSEEGSAPLSTETQIPLGEYLFLRVCQASPKIRSVFGIPGDFNLALLEHLYTESISIAAKLEFVGFCNELNAAYAADGYAKLIDGLSVLITTFGVGELSALNGIAGAFAEYAPVLHIVGTTSTEQAEQALIANAEEVRNIHHLVQNKNSLMSPDHDVYKPIVKNLSVIQESLDTDTSKNLEKIDRVLANICQERRPGYLYIPSNVSDIMVPASRLQQQLEISELTDEALLKDVTCRILDKLYVSEKPSVLGDALASRFGGQNALDDFVEAMPSNFVKLFSTLLARNIDETLPNFVGVYGGKLSSDSGVAASLEQDSDFLLILGHTNNEINSGAYSMNFGQVSDLVQVHPDYILIDGEYVHTKDPASGKRLFSIVDLIQRLAAQFKPTRLMHNDGKVNNINVKREIKQFALLDKVPAETITQNKLVDFFNAYLRPNDIVVCETCTFLFAVWDLRLPQGVTIIAQSFYESIGYALPATFGVSRAERDLGGKRRIILIQGDGAAQMTVQEWSTYLRYDIQNPQIFLLNNEGYTVERIIQGPTRPYNDIQDTWKWTEIFLVFGDKAGEKHETHKVSTAGDLDRLLRRKASPKIQLYELKLGKLDIVDKFRVLRE